MGGGNMLTVSCVVDPEPNQQVISLQMCGNGIVENGEDCDPGFNATSNCCDSATVNSRPVQFVILQVAPVAMHNVPLHHLRRSVDLQRIPDVILQRCVPVIHRLALQTTSRQMVSTILVPFRLLISLANYEGKSCGSGLNCASGLCTSLSRTCSCQSDLNLS